MDKSRGEYARLIKLLMIGDAGVGKTSILYRFSEDIFRPPSLATLGIDLIKKEITIEGENIKLLIQDTPGQERFRSITQSYYKGAIGAILVYDCTDKKSFNSILNWADQIKNLGNEITEMTLIGNKWDRPDKKITTDEGKALARELGISFLEASAKKNINVDKIFYDIAKAIKNKRLNKSKAVNAKAMKNDPNTNNCCFNSCNLF
ncbi:unnamed protein product [Blepharisma stoltei]|uniref:Uncharacterized protein n=1 Tax=Blepharisma stoltei TaxID=1481888 RepID=A0AAU9K4N4_9CILI|nr:unnamed protein product [Blepharisma stoltei]